MEWIDLETWPRREQYRYFRSLDRPQYDLCARLDVTRFCAFMKARGGSSYHAMGYFVVRAANGVPAFRLRIPAGRPLRHERVNPSFTEPR
ncbi:CatA-like O-acetyltransferase, partial [Anaerotruncus massiliensis (ex Liu et al. 2021)]|uniref:CatA-like O-acetyltransferase n=1 Tax=Anaerotruncus massiliensis (ex Liu et al. 2021) TaxID=2321404 RepID=UPI003AB88C8C